MSALDPVTLSVIQAGLQQVCNEMDLAFVRAAFSPVISEALDRSDGIYARDDGRLIAQGELGLPIFVGTMQFSTQALIARKPSITEGDIFAVNDPYLGGTHLMDVRFAMPYFYKGRHYCWLSNTGHWPDIGGMVPGGWPLRILPMLLAKCTGASVCGRIMASSLPRSPDSTSLFDRETTSKPYSSSNQRVQPSSMNAT